MALTKKEELEAICNYLVDNYQGFAQRSEEWHKTINRTVGGSEVSKLMGTSAESKAYTLAKEKLAALMGAPRWAGVPACWWGSLFEDALALVVGEDLGGTVVGDNICIQAVPGHRNSPDGYIVAAVENKTKVLRARDLKHILESDPYRTLDYEILLLEFKCPISRYPVENEVPSQYIPQLLSGLAVSPDASRGLFVDAVFCKCAFADFDDVNMEVQSMEVQSTNASMEVQSTNASMEVQSMEVQSTNANMSMKHDTDYHKCFHDCQHICRSDTPYAWGVVKLYTVPDTTNSISLLTSDLKSVKYLPNSNIIDLGAANTATFNKALQDISEKRLVAVHCRPTIAGNITKIEDIVDYTSELVSESDIESELKSELTSSLTSELVAIIPWKLAPPVYCIVNRQEGFLESLQPLITKIHKSVSDALETPNPSEYLLSCFDVKPRKKTKIAAIANDPASETTSETASELASSTQAHFKKMYK